MYIRSTKTKTADHGEDSCTYRIVEFVREETQVKQRTLLNPGKDFAIEPAHWPLLAARIEQLLQGSAPHQAELFALADDVGQLLEAAAEGYSTLIIAKLAQPVATVTLEQDYYRVNINHVEAVQARSIGVETLAFHAVTQLQLDQNLTAPGFNKIDSAAALGSIIGRMVSPGSELQTHDWLQSRTGLGELLDHDYGSTSLTRLYTISDTLLKHQSALEAFLAGQEQTLFDLNRSIPFDRLRTSVLYDLTNTYFEGQCVQNSKAQFGRSKETCPEQSRRERRDCPLVTLGLVLDGSGFPLGSQVFPGNASEPATLALMLDGLQGKNPLPSEKPVIIMDADIASAENIAWLSERGHPFGSAQDMLYLVVGRERYVQDPIDQESAVLVRKTEHNSERRRLPRNRCRNRGNPALLSLRSKSQKRTGHPQLLPRSFGRGARQAQCRLGQKSDHQKLRENT
jgi:hypothetical protein